MRTEPVFGGKRLEGPEVRCLEVAISSLDTILKGFPHSYVKEKLETAKFCIEAVLIERGAMEAP